MISIENLKKSVAFLSTIKPARSYNNINSLNNVTHYIEEYSLA